MELNKADAYLVIRTAYKTGLLKKIMAQNPSEAGQASGTSILNGPGGGTDMDLLEEYGRFLAELIYEVRREGKSDD